MKTTISVDAMYKSRDVYKNLARFAKKFPEAAEYCEFNKDCTIEQIAQSLPITDKYFADGTITNEWTYYFDIDFEQEGMYIWFIQRV